MQVMIYSDIWAVAEGFDNPHMYILILMKRNPQRLPTYIHLFILDISEPLRIRDQLDKW